MSGMKRYSSNVLVQQKAVTKVLKRLEDKGEIDRITRGIYTRTKISKLSVKIRLGFSFKRLNKKAKPI